MNSGKVPHTFRSSGDADHERRTFRIWLTYPVVQPTLAREKTGLYVAVEPAEPGVFCADEAQAWVRGYNRRAVERGFSGRALAIEVKLRYEGDLQPGDPLIAEQKVDGGS